MCSIALWTRARGSRPSSSRDEGHMATRAMSSSYVVIGRAGFPAITDPGSTDRVTTDPAPTTHRLPIRTPGMRMLLFPTKTSSPIRIAAYRNRRPESSSYNHPVPSCVRNCTPPLTVTRSPMVISHGSEPISNDSIRQFCPTVAPRYLAALSPRDVAAMTLAVSLCLIPTPHLLRL